MFLSALAKTCKDLGFLTDSEDFSLALEAILSAARHTNTMMWIGKMENCPLDLSGQGQLLKQGNVLASCGKGRNGKRWSIGYQTPHSCYFILFQQSLVLCRTTENMAEPDSPSLLYFKHFW